MKPISPTVHGVIDYASVAGLLAMAHSRPIPEEVRGALRRSAYFSLGYSLCTRYRLGLVKMLPMRFHLMLDLVSAASLLVSPEILGVREARSRRLLRFLGIVEIVVPLLTRSR